MNENEREEFKMLKTIRNVFFVLSAVFCWGIAGSIELERLTLTQGASYIAAVFAACAIVALAEFSFRAAKVLITLYAIKRKKARHTAYISRNYNKRGVSV